ncbi:MAG TPA: hypothetical protein VGR24_01260 [bacterium]|jgi:hypothetical protein|nr:hypothetical protein [bacterium]
MKRLLLAAMCAVYAGMIPAAHAAAPVPPATVADPVQVRVGTYLLNLGRLDTGTGTYTMDVYISMTCDRPCDPTAFEIMNGRATERVMVDNKPRRKVFRLQASLSSEMDLRNYPFDTHMLGIVIEDGKLAAAGEVGQTTDDQIYLVEAAKSGIAPTVRVAGWEVNHLWRATTTDVFYAPFGETYSRYQFAVRIYRPVLSAVLKVVLPAIFLVIVGLVSLLLAPDKVTQRLTVGTSALVGSVLLHLNLTSAIPPVGYLTFADKFMLFNYVPLVLAIVASVVMLWFTDRAQTDRAHRVHVISGISIPIIWVVLQGMNLLTLAAR